MTVGSRRQERGQLVLGAPAGRGGPSDAGDRDLGAYTVARARGHATAAPPDVVVVHGLAQHDVGVGVEASEQLVPVVLEVRLDGVATALKRLLGALGVAAEPGLELRPRSGS